jgi:hypothetical protein
LFFLFLPTKRKIKEEKGKNKLTHFIIQNRYQVTRMLSFPNPSSMAANLLSFIQLLTDCLFGKNQHSPGDMGSVHHYVSLLKYTPHPSSSFLVKVVSSKVCQGGHVQAPSFLESSMMIALSPDRQFQENIDSYFAVKSLNCSFPLDSHLPLEGPCAPTFLCPLASKVELVSFNFPFFLILSFDGRGEVELGGISILGKRYEPKAVTRFLPASPHFICYVKTAFGWFLHDGLGPNIQRFGEEATERDMRGERNFFFYRRI